MQLRTIQMEKTMQMAEKNKKEQDGKYSGA